MSKKVDYFTAALMNAVLDAGEKAKKAGRDAEVKAGDGHRSIVTAADTISNEHILAALAGYPEARFLCEENGSDSRILPRNNPVGLLECECAAVIDSLDGTTRFAGKYPDWSVAAGSISKGHIVGSAIYAPDANHGLGLWSADYIRGVSWLENNQTKRAEQLSTRPTKECVILRGVDTELYANMLGIMPKVAASVRAVYTEGSGLFGLMCATLGRAAAIIQTPQKAWDWVPAYHALTSVGGAFRFFRLVDGNLIPIDNYDFEAFTYKKENRLGFVAGEPEMANKLFALLPRSGWERHDPDTI